MTATPFRPLFLALGLALACVTGAANAQSQARYPAIAQDSTLVSINASAEASQVPDIATVSAGVVTQAVDGSSAMRQNAEQMARVLAAVRAAGIAERDVQTSGISLNPQYRYVENEAPTITGYQASNTVSLKVRDVANLGKVLDALAAQGSNQINGPSFEIDDPEPVYAQARVAALAKARARAEIYAQALDMRVRRIVSISEGGGGFQPMPMMAMAKSRDMAESTPVSPGETTLSVSLDVVFELGR